MADIQDEAKTESEAGYEILPRADVRRMHENFSAGLDDKAKKVMPAGAQDAASLLESLKTLLVASARKAIDLKAEELAGIAQAGKEAVEKRTAEIESRIHTRAPEASLYPSPTIFAHQKKMLAAAAQKRIEDAAVVKALGEDERIYLRLKGKVDVPPSQTQQLIDAYLEKRGYRVVDYAGGYATDEKGKQKFKIGKLLKAEAGLYKGFVEDSSRTLGSLFAVISRKADDIARMSTGRAWSSCMGSGGFNFDEYVPMEIQKGSLVAYLVSEKDPDIVNPLARILIKPFTETKTPLGRLVAAAKQVFGKPAGTKDLFIPSKPYGIANSAFKTAVQLFVEERLNLDKDGEFKLSEKLYADGLYRKHVRVNRVTAPQRPDWD